MGTKPDQHTPGADLTARPGAADQQIVWVYTEDLAATARFYAESVGLEMVHDQVSCRIYRAAPAAFIGVCAARAGRAVEPRGVVITLVSGDVDGWYRRLTDRGVPTDGPPRTIEPFNVYAFFATDPNGYRLEFQRFLDPGWADATG